MINLPAHPVGTSHYVDGAIPNQNYPSSRSTSDEKIYLQPTVQVQEVAKGALVKDNRKKSLCERIAEDKNPASISTWFDRHKGTLGWIGIGYITFRILTRNR